MAFFKFRKAGDDTPAAPQPGESAEVLRRRARHRLIGAAVLVLVAVLGFPLIFDNQPRPIAVDIPIEIPDKNNTKPLVIPAAPGADTAASAVPGVASAPVTAAAKVVPAAPVTPQVSSGKVGGAITEAPEPAAKVVAASAPAPAPEKAAVKPETVKPEPAKPQVADKPAPTKVDEAAKALALLEGKPVPAPAAAATPAASGSEERLIVQVGAFADAAKVREVRAKLERAGLKTFTQVAKTPEGERIRVRLGPFSKKAEAEAAATKVKKLDLPAAILTL